MCRPPVVLGAPPVPWRRLLGCAPLVGWLGAALALHGSEAAAQGLRDVPPLRPGPIRAAPPATAPQWTSPATDNSPEAQLGRAKLAYQRGDYGAAVLVLRPLLYPQSLLSQEDQVLLAHKLLALSYFFEHDEAGAEQELNLLLSLRPDFALDPVVDPIKAVAFLDDIRRRNEQRLQEIRRRQAEDEQRAKSETEALQRQAELLAQKQARRVYIERVVHRQFSALSLVPFGVPQLASHRRTLGAVLLTGELLTAGGSLGSWLTVRLRYPDNTFPPREYNTAQALTATYLTTGVVFWGLVLTGLIDALLHARTVTEVHELREQPKDLPKDAPKDPDREPPRPRLSFQPLGHPLGQPPAVPVTGGDAQGGLPPPASPSYGLQLGATF